MPARSWRTGEQFSGAITFGIRVDGGQRPVSAVESEIQHFIPPGVISTDHALAPVIAKADRTLKPISIALGVFGAVSLLAALLVGAQIIGRRIRIDGEDLDVLRALGADPLSIFADEMTGIVGGRPCRRGRVVRSCRPSLADRSARARPSPSIRLAGSMSTGPCSVSGCSHSRSVARIRGVDGLSQCATPDGPTPAASRPSGSRTVGALASAGLPASGVVGVRMALEPGEGRAAIPVRSVMLGAVLAVALVMATITFGSSLNTLVTHPALYGWNWTYILNEVGEGGANVPPQTVAMWATTTMSLPYSGLSFNDIELDGQTVPFIIEHAGAVVAPPVLSGHAVEGSHQVVLGAATLAQLHKHVGQTVTVSYGCQRCPARHTPDPGHDRGDGHLPCHRIRYHGSGPHLHGHRGMAGRQSPECVREGAAEPVRHSQRAQHGACPHEGQSVVAVGRADLDGSPSWPIEHLPPSRTERGMATRSRSWECNGPPRS